MSPIVLLILDGVGWGRRDDGDAVHLAQTTNLDALLAAHPWCLLQAHGKAVGMPSDEDMGNSEVGHNAMGAGRVFEQGAALVDRAVQTGQLFESPHWKMGVARARAGGTLHLLGLLSDGNVHSHVDHLTALIARASAEGVPRLRLHALTDGRDVGARTALQWVRPLEDRFASGPSDYAFATVGGRMHITMDRYQAEWGMVERGWHCHVHARGRRFDRASTGIETLYAEQPSTNDQWLAAFVVGDYAGMEDGDTVILFNFRGDRALEISRAFEAGPDFPHFDRGHVPELMFMGMMEYDGDLHAPARYLVEPPAIDDTVADHLEAAGKRVLAISETQKFGHVTYFFNGNRSDPPRGEDRREITSDCVPFDQAPAMKAMEIAREVCLALEGGQHDLYRVNLANGDMVGHTGDLDAVIRALETVDEAVGQIWAAVERASGVLVLTADHGNADEMFQIDKSGGYALDAEGRRKPSTSHSRNPVPLVLADPTQRATLVTSNGRLAPGGIARVGATLLDLLGLSVPTSYLPSLVHWLGR